jgi:PKD repeat protein
MLGLGGQCGLHGSRRASYAWAITNGQITSASNVQSIAFSAGPQGTITLKVIVTTTAGCSKECSKEIAILPVPDCTWTSNAPVDDGKPVQFNGPAEMDSYQWEFGDGSTSSAKDPVHLYPAAGSYGVSLIVSKEGCAKECTKVIPVTPGPECSWTSNSPVYDGTEVQFTGPAGMDSYKWDFGDGQVSSAKDPHHLYSPPSSYAVSLATTKCGSSKSCPGTIVVKSQPDCSWTTNSPVYRLNPVQFTGPAGMDSYRWSFGDGSSSVAQSPSHTYAAAGTYDVRLTVSKGGCSKTCPGTVEITSQCNDCWCSNSPVCDGTAVIFDGPSGMDSYKWNFGDGARSPEEDPFHLYSAPGTFTVILTVKSRR